MIISKYIKNKLVFFLLKIRGASIFSPVLNMSAEARFMALISPRKYCKRSLRRRTFLNHGMLVMALSMFSSTIK